MGKVIGFTAPEPRDGITHVVVVGAGLKRAYLFGSLESAGDFVRFGTTWLGWNRDDVTTVPLAVVGETEQ
jgi:hypothetical protein